MNHLPPPPAPTCQRCRSCRVSPPDHTARRRVLPSGDTTGPPVVTVLASWLALLLVAVLALAPAAAEESADQNGQERQLEAPLVASSHGVQAHHLTEQWVRYGLPEHPEEADHHIRVTGALGVRVTLRLDGMTIGRGDAYHPDPVQAFGEPGPAVDLVPMLHVATREALLGVQRNLRDAHRQALAEQYGDEAPEPTELADVADRLLVDVQLGHRTEPVEVDAEADLTAVLAGFAPGYHGLVSPGPGGDLGDAGEEAIVWPATAVATRSTPRGQLMRLLDARGRDPQALLELGRPDGVPLFRFQVVHVVRPQRHLPPRRLVRGQEILPQHIDSRTLDGLVERLAEHLQRRFTSDHLVRGTYYPTSHRYEPDVAETRDVALASYALMSYARRRTEAIGTATPPAQRAADAARSATARLVETLFEQQHSQRPAGLALALLTLVDDLEPGEHREARDRLAQALVDMYEPADDEPGEFHFTNEEGQRGTVTDGTAALLTAALAAHYEQTRSEDSGVIAAEQLKALWSRNRQQPNVAALPWLALAHHRAAHLLADVTAAHAETGAREREFAEMLERLLEHQVAEPPEIGPSDVIGGFELTAAPAGAPPSPDWRTAHMLTYLAMCLRAPEVTADRDAVEWVLRGALAARFIGQLMMDESGAYYVRSLPEATGGVRAAPWDNRLPVSATAMGLLASVKFQETLERHRDDLP